MANWGPYPPWLLQQQQQQAAAGQGFYPPNAFAAGFGQPHPFYYPQAPPAPQRPVQPPVQPSWNAGAYVSSDRPYRPDTRSKYPRLNPVLASDITVTSVDISKKPIQSILMQTYYAYRHTPAVQSEGREPVTQMRLFCKSFPWSIDIVTKNNATIMCNAVWESIYGCLQEPIADSEWGLVCNDKKLREKAEKAMKRRLEIDPHNKDKRMKRIDFLGEEKMFVGLEKDEEFQKTRTLPGSSKVDEVWVIKMSTP